MKNPHCPNCETLRDNERLMKLIMDTYDKYKDRDLHSLHSFAQIAMINDLWNTIREVVEGE